MKFNLLDDKLAITTSAYRTSFSNYNVADPAHRGFYLPAGGTVVADSKRRSAASRFPAST